MSHPPVGCSALHLPIFCINFELRLRVELFVVRGLWVAVALVLRLLLHAVGLLHSLLLVL